MDIRAEIVKKLTEAIKAEGERLIDEAMHMEPIIVGDLQYVSYVEFGKPDNVIDSTAIVIGESIPALPEPNTKNR